jgi:succinyl-CoA synthetase alpha subunit
MSILIDSDSRVIVQGITGRDGSFHALSMREYGTRVVGGVTPGKGGRDVQGIPVFESVKEAAAETGADTSVIFVPARFASAALREAAEAGMRLVVCITEGIPVQEMLANYHFVRERGVRLIGPNCPGLITPGQAKAGIMPGPIHTPGGVGVISRSGTLTYEVVYNLTRSGLGQSTCVGIGGDPVVGTGYLELLEMFERDPGTQAVVLIGEIGGEEEEQAAEYIRRSMRKPVAAFISGRTAPPGKRMGHAGAIISGGKGTAEAKVRAFREAGVQVADRPDQIPALLRQKLGKVERA